MSLITELNLVNSLQLVTYVTNYLNIRKKKHKNLPFFFPGLALKSGNSRSCRKEEYQLRPTVSEWW